MDAGALQCPMCGAPAAQDATRCDHCGAQLASIACPSCFKMIFEGSKFCPHCGAKLGQAETGGESAVKPCPRCRVPMNAVTLGAAHLDECGKCHGIWASVETLTAIQQNSEKLAAADTVAAPELKPAHFVPQIDDIRYVPCPVCEKLMNRVNFAQISGVIVDVCRTHGTWFDPGELQNVVEFIRTGGIGESRRREVEELEARKRAAKFSPPMPAGGGDLGGSWDLADPSRGLAGGLVGLAYLLLRFVLR